MQGPSFPKKEDLVKYITQNDFKILNLCHIPEDGRVKTLSFSARNEERVSEILEYGERADGSSLFSSIEADKSDVYIAPRFDKTFPNPFAALKTLNILCDYLDADGKPLEIAPRSVLMKAQEKLQASSRIDLRALAELEFYVISRVDGNANFPGEPEKNYHESTPFAKFEGLRNDIIEQLESMGIKTKYGHGEVGRIIGRDGTVMEQHEIEFFPERLVDMADTVTVAKWVVRNVCAIHGATVSFSPKIAIEHAGTGLHVHVFGLRNGKNVVAGENGELSDYGLKMIGGILKLAPSLSAFGNTTPVSYLRFADRKESPMQICWSNRNRLALVRIPLWWSFEKSNKVSAFCRETFEYRGPDALANAHFLLAALGMAIDNGLTNGKESIEFTKETLVSDRKLKRQGKIGVLPRSCVEAADYLSSDKQPYTTGGVFPNRLIDGIIDRLRAYADKDLWKNLIDKPEELQRVLNSFLYFG
jgi:glutamine synthetase